ncbi:MAG: WG repeat-containing protein [Clostridia bacterium]|nr:WG repeat-containing protein [Clostridia bacterium]
MKKSGKKRFFILLIVVAIILIGIIIIRRNTSKSNSVSILEITEDQMNYYKIKKEDKYGVIDKNGKVVIEPKFIDIEIPNPTKDLFLCTDSTDINNIEWKAYNAENNQILTEYKSVEAIEINQLSSNIPYEKTVLKYKDGNLYGLIDFDGNKIIQAQFEDIQNIDYKEGYLKIKKDGAYGVVTIEGKRIIQPEFNDVMSDGYYNEKTKYSKAGFLLQIKSDEGYKYGYANLDGKEVIDTTFSELSRIIEIEDEKDVYFISTVNGKKGLIKNGKQIIENELDDISYDSITKLLVVEKNASYGIKDLDGKQILPIEYDSINIGGDYINANNGEEREVFDTNGNKLDTKNSSHLKVSKNYSIIIDENNYYNIEDSSNNILLKDQYVYIEYFTNDLFIATIDNNSGVINSNGNVVIPLKYSSIQKIDGTEVLQATLLDNNKVDLINASGELISGLENGVIDKTDKYIKLISKNNVKYFDYSGNEKSYQDIVPNNKIYASNKDGKWGFVDNKGNVVVNYEYDMVTEQNGNTAGIKKDGLWGVIDTSGKIVLNPTYKIDWENVKFLSTYYEISGIRESVYSSDIQQ